jgi:hypothetical protein
MARGMLGGVRPLPTEEKFMATRIRKRGRLV